MSKRMFWGVLLGLLCIGMLALTVTGTAPGRAGDPDPASISSSSTGNVSSGTSSAVPVDEMIAAKAALIRLENGVGLPGDKELVERYLPAPVQTPAERDRDRVLDDNGGVWFNWTGSLAIPDAGCPTLVVAPIAVTGMGVVQDVEVTIVQLTHTWDSDLRIYLRGPNGVQIELSTQNGGSGDNYVNTVFDDEAATAITAGTAPFTGSYRPEGLLSTYDGTSANGTWQLEICDGAGADLGTLTGWRIQLLAPAGGPANLSVGALSPCGPQDLDPAHAVGFRVTNIGGETSAATTARFNYDNGVTMGQAAVGALASGTFVDVNFAQTINITVGNHSLVGYVDNVDQAAANDTARCTVTGRQCFDYTLTAPGTVTGNTSGALDDCNLRTGQDQIVRVTLPVDGNWTFSMCNTSPSWDTYLFLTSGCCSGTLAFNDDFCGLLSQITMQLAAGTYYVDIEPYGSTTTGAWQLDVTRCVVEAQQGDINEVDEPWPLPPGYSLNDPDGGCNNDPTPQYQTIQCGQSIFGRTFLYIDDISGQLYRDTDWYALTLTTTQQVTWTFTGERAVAGIIVGAPCPGTSLVSGQSVGCLSGTITMCLGAGTYYLWIGATGSTADTQPYLYRATVTCADCPSGRCCYGDPLDPDCQDVNRVVCTDLGGTWDGTTTCANPCPIRPGCPVGTQYSQIPHLPTDGWSAATSEVQPGYRVYENYSVTSDIYGIRFFGLNAYFNGSAWVACTENPMPLNIGFYADNAGVPAATPTCTYDVTLAPFDWTQYNYSGLSDLMEYQYILPTACTLHSGWVSIQGAGSGTCWYLWLSATGGNGTSLQWNGTSYTTTTFDRGVCLLRTARCDSAMDVTVYLNGSNNWVHFNAPVAGSYAVYSTTDRSYPGGTPPPGAPWVLEATVTAVAGDNAWTDPAAVTAYKRYAVIHVCN